MLKDQGSASKPQRSHELSVPLYSPRTSYNNICNSDESYLVDLTLNFDSYTINVLKAEFKARNGKMPFLDFVLILKEQLSNWQKDLPFREKRLMRVLTLLFEEININGNGVLEWTEFTTYIVDKATVLNTMKSKNDEIKAYTPLRLKVAKKFDALLTKIIYLEDIDRVAFLEEGSDEIHFLNHETGAFNPKPLKVTPPKDDDSNKASKVKVNSKGGLKSHAEKSMVLDMIYVREKKSYFLLTSSDDCAIRTWRYSSNGFVNTNAEEEGAIYFSQAQVCIAWDEINQILYSGQRDGAINIWDRKSDTIIGKLHTDGHTDLIMDIIPLPKLQLVATCSLDKTIILWNTITNRKVRVFKEHTRGVVSLAFNKSLILLVSAGYDHQICVWNPYIDNAVFKITAHSSPLVGVKIIEGSSQFVSLDTSGTIKIWDFRKFNCTQTLSLETVEDKHKFHPQAFAIIPKPRKLAFAGRTLNFFEYDRNYNPNAVDDSVAVGVCYRPQNNTILTPTGNKIKVWNALTGEIKRIYSDISQAEITVFKLDEIKKRCLIGFSNGEAGAYNVLNGALLKTYTKHSSELTHIIEAKDLGFIITASASDGTIKVHTDKTVNESELARVITLQEVALTAIVYQPLNRLIVTGTQNGIVAFWEAETGKFLGQCACFGIEEIASIVVLKDLDYVIAATSTGKIGIIVTPPSTLRYNKIFEFINYDDDGLKVPVYPVHMIWSHEKRLLFIADDRSWLKVYDLSDKVEDLYKHQEIEKETKLKEANSSKFTLRLPKISTAVPNKLWATKAHNDPIKSLEYSDVENLLFTSALDKKVKIWNAHNGKFIDSLQQRYDGIEPSPVAYKKPGSDGIYSPDLVDRIDLEHTNKIRNEFLKGQAELRALAEKYNIDAGAATKLGTLKTLKTMGSIRVDPSSPTKAKREEEKKDPNDKRKFETKASIFFSGKGGEDGDNKQRHALESVILSAYGGDEIGRTLIDLEEEEFDPFYNWRKIDLDELDVKNSSQWRLHVNFQENKNHFDNQTGDITKKVYDAEKNDVVGRLTSDQPIASTTTRATEPDDPNLSDKRALVDQEAQMMKKLKEQEKMKEKNIEAVIGNQLKEGHIMKGAIQYQNDNKYSQVKSKIGGALHRKALKGKALDKHKKVVSLTEEEAQAAKRLADALSNYDKDDQRNVKFLEFQVKQQGSTKERKDFISLNRQKIALNAGQVTGRSDMSVRTDAKNK